jgi:hypothetical protein
MPGVSRPDRLTDGPATALVGGEHVGPEPVEPQAAFPSRKAVRSLRRVVSVPSPIPAVAVTSAAVALIVYWLTLLPGVSFGDWAEMQSIPFRLGIAHPTGYPLYILLGKLWSLLPVGSVAYRADLLSAVYAASAIGVTVLILGRLRVRAAVAGPVALVLGAIATTWEAGTTARVDALHLLLVAAILHRALVWGQERRARDLYLLALLIGLSFANHMLTATVAPFVGVYALWVGRHELRRRSRQLLVAALSFGLGLLPYLYIPLRASLGPAWAYGRLTTLPGLVNLVRGSVFAGDMTFLSPAGLGNYFTHVGPLTSLITARWNPILLVLAVIGWLVLVRTRPAFGLLASVLLLVNTYVYVNYVGHLEHYLLLSWLLLVISIGVAIEAIASLITRWAKGALRVSAGASIRHPALTLVPGLLLLIAPMSLAVTNWRSQDRSQDHQGEAFVAEVFAALPPNAVLLTYWDAIEPLWYAHCVEGERPDLTIIANPDPGAQGCQDLHAVNQALVRARPTYALLPFNIDAVVLGFSYHLTQVATIRSPYGNPYPQWNRPLLRLSPPG